MHFAQPMAHPNPGATAPATNDSSRMMLRTLSNGIERLPARPNTGRHQNRPNRFGRARRSARVLLLSLRAQRLPLALFLGCALLAQARASDVAWIEGITEPIRDVTLSSAVIGVIGARWVEEGAFVKKGQVLVELDKGLEELDVSRKELTKETAKAELERLKALSARSAISVSVEEMEKKRAEYDLATLDWELAKEQLNRRLIIAPIDGFVTDTFLDVGEGCEPRDDVLRLVDTRECHFVANVDAKLGHTLKAGQQFPLLVETGDEPVRLQGTINYVSPVVDPASGLMRIKLLFENTNAVVRPGVSGRMLLKAAPHAQ